MEPGFEFAATSNQSRAEVVPFLFPEVGTRPCEAGSSPLQIELAHAQRELAYSQALAAEMEQRLWDTVQALTQLAERVGTDPLTGLRHRRWFDAAFESAFSLATRHALPLSLVFVEVDHHATYREDHGRAAADGVLRTVSSHLRECTREHDLLARCGPAEFIILLIATGETGARACADRVRVQIEHTPWPTEPVTASLGAASFDPNAPGSIDLIGQARKALEAAIRQGRNRVLHSADLVDALNGSHR